MARDPASLPQLSPEVFLTDSGLETDLVFNQGVDLPEFAAFPLLEDSDGARRLRTYFDDHVAVASKAGAGFVLETVTWRANSDWGALLGYDADALDRVNRLAVDLVADVRAAHADDAHAHAISGCLGPRGDAYRPGSFMTADEAADYHRPQIETFADTEADLVSALTLTYAAEGTGIARAARVAAMPVVLSFTVETDGRLPDGSELGDAISEVDAATGGYPSYYTVNCAHPTHFAEVLDPGAAWMQRIRGIRCNASTRSHAELDEATELDAGDPVTFGREYADLRSRFPGLTVLGGCCGTDVRHVQQIAAACL